MTIEHSVVFPSADGDIEVLLEGEKTGVSTHLDEPGHAPSLLTPVHPTCQ